ncbi:MAG: MarR family transcriptional regulator [Atopobiaceae bacterium]|nr:MarR family transcriptional regulator [Atopobiaceae bacterium]
MEVPEYLSMRRAYNIVRQQVDTDQRLTFSEFAILCRLSLSEQPLKTSKIADYQGCLRPTMTHRTKHLSELGLIEREKGSLDRRNVVCALTPTGLDRVHNLCELTRARIVAARPSSRITAERICRMIDATGTINYMARDLILLKLATSEQGRSSVGELVESLGFLQPTVSMSVSALKDEKLVIRGGVDKDTFGTFVIITESGKKCADGLKAGLSQISISRARRKA